jgi:hypothetical protein
MVGFRNCELMIPFHFTLIRREVRTPFLPGPFSFSMATVLSCQMFLMHGLQEINFFFPYCHFRFRISFSRSTKCFSGGLSFRIHFVPRSTHRPEYQVTREDLAATITQLV